MATTRSGTQISKRRLAPVCPSTIDGLRQRFLAPVAEAGPGRVARDRSDIAPAPLALHAARAFDGYRKARPSICARGSELNLGHDEDHRQIAQVGVKNAELCLASRDDGFGLQRAADLLVLPERLDLTEHLF